MPISRRLVGTALVGVLALVLVACSSSSSPSSASSPDAGGGEAGSGAGLIGDPCPAGDGDCQTGLKCAGEDPGGGQCFKECTPSVDTGCGDTTKYVCSSEGHCYLRCTQTTDCKRAAQGYVCKDDTPARPPVKFCDTP
jgi:hypothetical protein